MGAFRIGAKKGDHVDVDVTPRDGWLELAFSAMAAGFGVADRARLAPDALARFRDDLRALDEGRRDEASLVTDDRILHLLVARDGDRFRGDCLVALSAGGSVVKLGVALDGAKLAELVWALDGAVRDVT